MNDYLSFGKGKWFRKCIVLKKYWTILLCRFLNSMSYEKKHHVHFTVVGDYFNIMMTILVFIKVLISMDTRNNMEIVKKRFSFIACKLVKARLPFLN